MSQEETHPLFSKELRGRMALYLRNLKLGQDPANPAKIQTGIGLIIEALTEL